MKTEHTPGPWFVDDTKRNGLYIRTESIKLPGADKGAAVAQAPHGAVGYSQALANANLIASAPDLLAALETIAYEPIGHAEASHAEVLQGCVDIAKAAIAKAKGLAR